MLGGHLQTAWQQSIPVPAWCESDALHSLARDTQTHSWIIHLHSLISFFASMHAFNQNCTTSPVSSLWESCSTCSTNPLRQRIQGTLKKSFKTLAVYGINHILRFKWLLKRSMCTDIFLLPFVILCFDIQTLLKRSHSKYIWLLNYIMENIAKFKVSLFLLYKRFITTAVNLAHSAAWWLPALLLLFQVKTTAPMGLPSSAALLKGTLTVIAEGRFVFLIQFTLPRFPAGLGIWNSNHPVLIPLL